MTEQARFARCLVEVLRHEGGYVDHPRDPGGATNKGVTQRVYDAYRKRTGLPKRSVRQIEPGEVNNIYRADYWLNAACDRLPAGLDYMVFDTAVNMGVSRACKYLQTAAAVKPDGIIGPVTLNALKKYDPRVLIDLIFSQRKDFYTSSPNFDAFGRGWMSRLRDVRAKAEFWAQGEVA